jgi:hypothetical protein
MLTVGTPPIVIEPAGTASHPRLRDLFVSVAFVLALAVPGTAMVLGVRSPLIENRPAATIPPITVGAVADPDFYAAADQAVDDAFPLRAAAVQARAALDYEVLHGSPNAQLVVGRDGWLFLVGEIRPKCLWHSDEILETWDSFASMLARDGIEARFLIAPDKYSVYPEMLPAGVSANDPCTAAERPAMEAGMESRPTTVDLWGPVLGATTSDDARYFQRDTHWTETGAMPAIRALVESLRPGLWESAPPVRAGTKSFVGDLSRLAGLPSSERAAIFERPGVSLTPVAVPTSLDALHQRRVWRFTTSGSDVVVPGRTLILYDSFFATIQDDVAAWFADSVWLHIDDLTRHPEVVGGLPAFDRVVLARTERLAYLTNYAEVLKPLAER